MLKPLKIQNYKFGAITIDGREYRRDLIILPNRIHEGWWRAEGHILKIGDLQIVLTEAPDVLIVGTGYSGCMAVSSEMQERLSSMNIKLISLRTKDATDLFNRLSSGTRVAAALHLTC